MSLRLWVAVCCSLPCVATAMEVEQLNATFVDQAYEVELTAVLHAPVEHVRQALRDYERYPALDDRILEAKVLGRPDPHTALLYTKLHACIGWFCRNINRVERVQESPNDIAADVLPERSDVRSGSTRTTWTAINADTRISYRTRLEPGFWVPSLFGRHWLLASMQEATRQLFERVEARAQAETRGAPSAG